MSKQKLTASQKRVNLFLCFCVRVLNVILKIVTCIASKVIPGTTDRIKGTTFSCYTHTHTHIHTEPFLVLCDVARFETHWISYV